MGKPYDHQYHKPGSGSAGEMICAACRNAIDGVRDEWRSYKRTKDGDWGYVTHHRNCSLDDPEWARRDAAEKRARERMQSLVTELAVLAKRYPEFSIADFLDGDALTDPCFVGGRV